MPEKLTREEAVQLLTMQRDLMDEAQTKEEVLMILLGTGNRVGYTPAFRCLVVGLEPEASIKWE